MDSFGDLINIETEIKKESFLPSFNGYNRIVFTKLRKQLVTSISKLTSLISSCR